MCDLKGFNLLKERNYEANSFRLKPNDKVNILSVVQGSHHQSAKVIFDDNRTVDFKYIWVNYTLPLWPPVFYIEFQFYLLAPRQLQVPAMRWSIDKAKVAWHAITWCQHTPRAIERERRRPIGCRMGRERSNTRIALRTRLVKQILVT